MADYINLKNSIRSAIKANGNNEITGNLLQQILVSMVSNLGAAFQFAGVATQSTNPGTPDYNVAYLAGPGTYQNMGGSVVPSGYIGVIAYNGSWSVQLISVGSGGSGSVVTFNSLPNGTTQVLVDGVVQAIIPSQYTLLKLSAFTTTPSDVANGAFYYNTSDKQIYQKRDLTSVVIPYYDGAIYTYNNALYVWNGTDLVNVGGGDFLTEPDDLTLEAVGNTNILKFANRSYNSQNPNGMGYKILRNDSTFAEQVTDANTIYEIRYDFDNVGTVNLPENSILLFKGGKISGTTLNGNKTQIDADLAFILDIALGGTWNVESFFPEWFGAIGDGTTDDTAAFAKLDGKHSRLSKKTYLISNVTYSSKTCIIGSGRGASVLKQKNNSTGDFITLLNWDYGILKDLTIEGGTGIVEQNYQQALVKMKTTSAATSSYRSIIENVAINNSMYNGLSILGNGDVDNGVTCNYNWIFTISNLFVGYCSRVCIYNKSTDNQFSNINASGGKLAGIIENGSSNNWVNLKVDGESCSLCDKSNLPALLANVSQGAAVIIGGVLVSFINLDIQSSHICGIKIVSGARLHITGNMNNCALGISDKSQKQYAPALYVINGLLDSELSLIFRVDQTQYKQFSHGQGADIARNLFNFKFQPNYSGERSYEPELMLCKRENIINDTTLFPSSSEIKQVENLLPENTETSSIFYRNGGTVSNDGEIFGGETPSYHLPDAASTNGYELLQSPASRGCRPGDVMLVMMVIKPVSLPQNPTFPYFNIVAVGSNESVNFARQDNVQYADAVVGQKYLISCIFIVPSTGNFNVRCYRIANSGEYYISNIKQYNITKDIGFCIPKISTPIYQSVYHIMDVLFASNNLAELNSEFDDIPVDMSLLGNSVLNPSVVTQIKTLEQQSADYETRITALEQAANQQQGTTPTQ